MSRRLEGKVALITGAARGQGRSHAIEMAREGARIIAVDCCAPIASVTPFYEPPTPRDLAETERLVRDVGGSIESSVVDVCDLAGLRQAVKSGAEAFGRLDTVVGNAGVFTFGPAREQDAAAWNELIDVNVTGVWNTVPTRRGKIWRLRWRR